MENNKFFKCDCYSHGIEVNYDEEENEKSFIFVMWNYNQGKRPYFFKRLKKAFKYIIYGEEILPTEIILDDIKAKELSEWIQSKNL